MITPGFFNLYNAHRGLLAAQSALNVVNQNISNANTPNYSRQRVELTAAPAYSMPSLHMSDAQNGQLGQGVLINQIARIRDSFLDGQFRTENAILGKHDANLQALQQIESILGEPSDASINASLQKFFESAQELSLNPESLAVRTNFLSQARDIVTVFQQKGRQLTTLRENLVGDPAVPGSFDTSQLAIRVAEVNDLLSTITRVNQQINTVQATGAQPNDLLDQRDELLDKLSRLADIDVEATANFQISISLGGVQLVRGVTLRDTLQVVQNPGGPGDPNPDDVPALVQTVSGLTTLNDTITQGEIAGILAVGSNAGTQTTVRSVLESLDTLLDTVATAVNTLQTTGRDLTGTLATDEVFTLSVGTGLNLFNYSVNPALLANPRLIAAAQDDPTASGPPAGFAGPGDGRNALAIAQLRNTAMAALGNTVPEDFLSSTVSQLGIDTRSVTNQANTQSSLITALEQRRQSTSGVNTDEELVNMIRYQRAFEASSRMIKLFDEIAQSIINLF